MLRRLMMLLVPLSAVAGCGDDPVTRVEEGCGTVPLPLRGDPNGPTVTDVGLEVQDHGIVIVATATDPQGSDNLRDALQSVSLFPDTLCGGTPLLLRDDLVGSGVEETFGTVVEASRNRALYDAIAGSLDWPVEVDFQDVDGHHTSGRVAARVIR